MFFESLRYNRLSKASNYEYASPDPENSKVSMQTIYQPNLRQKLASIIISPYPQFVLFLILLSQFAIILRLYTTTSPEPSKLQACHVDWDFIATRFEWDSRYMTLDHQYDGLWNETATTAAIETGDGHGVNDADVGVISM